MTPYARLGVLIFAGLCVSECQRAQPTATEAREHEGLVVRVASFTEYGPDRVPRVGFRTDDGRVVIEPVYSTAWAFSEDRAAVRDSSGRWGFISSEGVEVIPTQYEAVLDFSEGLVAAKLHGKWGFIDREGQVVIPFRYTSAGRFSEGLAEVQPDGESLMGMIDTSGNIVIPARFRRVLWHKGGYADAQDPQTTLWGVVDHRGTWVVPPRYDQCCDRRGNEVHGQIYELWGFIGRDGEWRIPPLYLHATRFFDDVATARLRTHGDGSGQADWRHVFLDPRGQLLAGPYEEVRDFLGGVGEFLCAKHSGWGAIDARGRLLRPCDPEEGRPLGEERLQELARQNWVQHLGRRGRAEPIWFPPLAFSQRDTLWEAAIVVDGLGIRQFHEGVAAFYRVDDPGCPQPWGILRTGGAIVTEPRYSFVGRASEGLIAVCVPVEGATKPEYCDQCHCDVPLNLCGYVDLNGRVRIPLEHLVDFNNRGDIGTFVGSFHQGLAALQDGETLRMGYIDRTGKWAIPPRFARAGEFASNGLAPASLPRETVVHELPQ